MKKADIEATVQRLWHRAVTWNNLEKLAGVTDRQTFWREHKTDEAVRAELRKRIRERVIKGELS